MTTTIEIGFITFTCPLCGQHLQASNAEVGQDVTCHGCDCTVTVPEQGNGQTAKLAKAVPRHAESAKPRCVLCGSEKTVEVRRPKHTTGIVVMLIGLLLAPVLIGLPLMLWGIDLMRHREDWWRCSGCGAATPITIANCPDAWKPFIFVPTWAIIAFALLCVLAVGGVTLSLMLP